MKPVKPATPIAEEEKNYEDISIDSNEVYEEIKKGPKKSFGIAKKVGAGLAVKVLGNMSKIMGK